MKKFEDLTEEEQLKVIMEISTKLDKQENLYWLGLVHEYKRLKELINQYEEEHTATFEEWKRDIKAFDKLESWLEEQENLYNKQKHPVYLFSSNTIRSVKNKIKELRGSDK